MDSDEMWEVAMVLNTAASETRAALNAAQPRTTKEQWESLDCLSAAANQLFSAAAWLNRHEKKKVTK